MQIILNKYEIHTTIIIQNRQIGHDGAENNRPAVRDLSLLYCCCIDLVLIFYSFCVIVSASRCQQAWFNSDTVMSNYLLFVMVRLYFLKCISMHIEVCIYIYIYIYYINSVLSGSWFLLLWFSSLCKLLLLFLYRCICLNVIHVY